MISKTPCLSLIRTESKSNSMEFLMLAPKLHATTEEFAITPLDNAIVQIQSTQDDRAPTAAVQTIIHAHQTHAMELNASVRPTGRISLHVSLHKRVLTDHASLQEFQPLESLPQESPQPAEPRPVSPRPRPPVRPPKHPALQL